MFLTERKCRLSDRNKGEGSTKLVWNMLRDWFLRGH
jgi:hypothetical protein